MQRGPKTIRYADIYNDNFNHYFTEHLNRITEEQKAKIPEELMFKIFTHGKEASAEKLNFNEKMYMLEVVFQKHVLIAVSDMENGLNAGDLNKASLAQKSKITNTELLGGMRETGTFVLSGNVLTKALLYMSMVCETRVYQLIKQHVPNADHRVNKKFVERRREFEKNVAFMINYEAKKKRITMDYGLDMNQWYGLLYFFNEQYAIDFYNKDLTYAYNSSRINLFKGMKALYAKGLLNKKTVIKKDKYSLSAKGADLLGRIYDNILLKNL